KTVDGRQDRRWRRFSPVGRILRKADRLPLCKMRVVSPSPETVPSSKGGRGGPTWDCASWLCQRECPGRPTSKVLLSIGTHWHSEAYWGRLMGIESWTFFRYSDRKRR